MVKPTLKTPNMFKHSLFGLSLGIREKHPKDFKGLVNIPADIIVCLSVKGIVHYFTMSILKECAVNGHHNGGILSFKTFTNREKWTK